MLNTGKPPKKSPARFMTGHYSRGLLAVCALAACDPSGGARRGSESPADPAQEPDGSTADPVIATPGDAAVVSDGSSDGSLVVRDSGTGTDSGPAPDASPPPPADAGPAYEPTTDSIGPATAHGTVDGETPPVSHGFAFALEPLPGSSLYAVTLRPSGGTCQHAFETMPERTVYFTVCAIGDQHVGDSCDRGEITYFIEATARLADGTKHKATAGSVHLSELDLIEGQSVQGTYNFVFESGSLAGTFDTVWCGTTS